MNEIKAVKLFFQEGTSDKVYHATIVEEDGLYTVKVEWGRRGAALATGAKAVRVSLAQAEKAFDKVVREKTGKGYEAITDTVAPAAVAPPVGQGSGSKVAGSGRARLPQAAQLLNAVEEDAVERLLADPKLIAQQKLDGMRVLTHVNEESSDALPPPGRQPLVVATNRQGQVLALDRRLRDAVAQAVPAASIVDGEVVAGADGPVYWLFDLLQESGEDLRPLGYRRRYDRLAELELAPPLRLVPSAVGEPQKRALFAELEAQHAEGIVFKRDDAPYKPGRPASGGAQLKYKFIKSADVFLTENAGNAYQMAVHDGERVHLAGKVFAGTTSESRRQIDELLAAGETPVAEVRYLYATDDDILYQPVFAGLRDDKEPADCTLAQLVRTNRAVAAEAPAKKAAAAKATPPAAKPPAAKKAPAGTKAPAAASKPKRPARTR